MTVADALTVATLTDRQLHDAGYAWADRARHDALDTLAAEVQRVTNVAGEVVGTDPDIRTSGCVDALVVYVRQLEAKPQGSAWARLVAEVDAKQAQSVP